MLKRLLILCFGFLAALTHARASFAQTTVVRDTFSTGEGYTVNQRTPEVSAGSTWLGYGSAYPWISGHQLGLADSSGAWAAVVIDSGVSDGTVSVDWTPNGAGTPFADLLVRFSDTSNYFRIVCYGGALTLTRMSGGVGTTLATMNLSPSGSAHHIEARLNGSAIEVWWNGVREFQVTDTFNVSATRSGMWFIPVLDSTSTYDNFTVVNAPPVVDHVVVSSGTTATPAGTSILFSGAAYTAANQLIPDKAIEWTVTPASAGTLTTSGSTATLSNITSPATMTATADSHSGSAAFTLASMAGTTIYDSFTGSNGALLANHTPDVNIPGGAWTIVGQTAVISNTQAGVPNTPGAAIAFIDGGDANATVDVDFMAKSAPVNGYPITAGVLFRVQDASNYWMACYGCGGYPLGLWKVEGGNWTRVTSASVPNPVAGVTHHIKVGFAGPGIVVSWDGVQLLQATDSFNQTMTKNGLFWSPTYDWESRFDNFSITPMPPTHLVVTPNVSSVPAGGTQFFAVAAYDTADSPVPYVQYQWSVSPASAAALTTAGATATLSNVTGTVTLTATPVGSGPSATATVSPIATATFTVFDSFTSSNGTLLMNHAPDVNLPGGLWTEVGAPIITNTQAGLGGYEGAIGYAQAWIDGATADGVIAADFVAKNGPNSGYPIGGVLFRVQDADNLWVACAGCGSYSLGLWKEVGGEWTLVTSATLPSPVAGVTHHIAVRLSGPSIVVSWDGTDRIVISDSFNQGQTKHGLRWASAYDWLSRFDNFSIQPPLVDHIVVSPGSSTVEMGTTASFSAQAYDAENHVVPNIAMRWSIPNSGAASLVYGGYTTSGAMLHAIVAPLTVTARTILGVSASTEVQVSTARTSVFDSFSSAGGDGAPLMIHVPDISLMGSRWTIPNTVAPVIAGGHVQAAQPDVLTMTNGALIETGTPDGVVGVDFSGTTYGTAWGSPLGGISFRATDAQNRFIAYYYGGAVSLSRFISGQREDLMSTWVGDMAGRTGRLEVTLNGPTIAVLLDGAQLFQVSDTYNLEETQHGLYWVNNYDFLSTFDNFSVRIPANFNAAQVVVTQAASTIDFGGTQKLWATAFNASGQRLPTKLFRWTTSDPDTALTPAELYGPMATLRGIIRDVTVTATPMFGESGSGLVVMDSGGTLVFDSFTGDDNTALNGRLPVLTQDGHTWSVAGTPGAFLLGNQAAVGGQSQACCERRMFVDSSTPDAMVVADWITPPAGSPNGPLGGVIFRATDPSNFWMATYGFYGSFAELWRVQGGAWSLVAGGDSFLTLEPGSTHRVEVHTDGPNIGVWWDGHHAIQAKDFFNVTATRHGIEFFDGLSRFDNFLVKGNLPCVTEMSTVSTIAAPGGPFGVGVYAPYGCVWQAETDASWLALTTVPGGNGSATVGYYAEGNWTGESRTATIVAGGHIVFVVQPPLPLNPCGLSLYPSGVTFPADGGIGQFPVTANSDCDWTAVSSADWLTPGTTSYTGSGWESFGVGRNDTGSGRTATITIGGGTFTVQQSGVFDGQQVNWNSGPPPASGGGGGSGSNNARRFHRGIPSQPWMSLIPRSEFGNPPNTFLAACNNMDQWPTGLAVTASLGSFAHDLAAGSDAALQQCFSNMRAMGLELTIEAAAYQPLPRTPGGCGTGSQCYDLLAPLLARLKALAAPHIRIRMQEPLTVTFQYGPLEVNASDHALTETLLFMEAVRQNHPDVSITLVESYPFIDAPALIRWMTDLTTWSALMGMAPPDSFELDHNSNQMPWSWSDVSDLLNSAHSLGWAFGYIFGSPIHAASIDWFHTAIAKGLGAQNIPFDLYVFESWESQPPDPALTIPEVVDSDYTFMSTVRVFRQMELFPR